jgi:hypothetical protein
MKRLECIGISNAVSDTDQVVHTTLMGRSTFGRVADLLCEWSDREYGFQLDTVSGLRMLVQAMLEFSIRGEQQGTPMIEFAVPSSNLIVAIRFTSWIECSREDAEKAFTQHWLNSPEAGIFKRILNPEDRIEVRYQPSTRLVEWRVVRPLGKVNPADMGVSFVVMVDSHDQVTSEHESYRDLGDLPYEEWLQQTYSAANKKSSGSGEVTLEEGETLEEVELARFTIDREISDEESRIVKSADSADADHLEALKREADSGGDEDGGDLKRSPEIEALIEEMKLRERTYRRDSWIVNSKVSALENLLNRKERMILRLQSRQRSLTQEVAELRAAEQEFKQNNPFKEKAMQMFDALAKAKRENQILEKTLADMKRKENHPGVEESFADSERAATQRNLEELHKKLERANRALESEKAKSNQLSARAMLAEKELSKADPMIKDLEAKVETVMKTSNQAKKEVETVKQRLVQAEAEKNRIQNELVKAQGQIATLMKRQAS